MKGQSARSLRIIIVSLVLLVSLLQAYQNVYFTLHHQTDQQQQHLATQQHTSVSSEKESADTRHDAPVETYDFVPSTLSLGRKFPACAGPLNRTDIIHTLNQPPWKDMDWQSGWHKRACGLYKCYLPSKSDKTIGYLVATQHVYQDMRQAHEIQNDLRDTLGAHVLAIPGQTPQMMNISTTIACFLVQYFGPAYGYRDTLPNEPVIVIHAVRRAPEPHVLLGSAKKKQSTLSQWTDFIQEANNHANATAVYQQLTREFAKMQQAVDKYPKLYCDWQALTDVHGNLWHVDVDRMFSRECRFDKRIQNAQKNYQQHIPNFLEMAKQVAADYEARRGRFAVEKE